MLSQSSAVSDGPEAMQATVMPSHRFLSFIDPFRDWHRQIFKAGIWVSEKSGRIENTVQMTATLPNHPHRGVQGRPIAHDDPRAELRILFLSRDELTDTERLDCDRHLIGDRSPRQRLLARHRVLCGHALLDPHAMAEAAGCERHQASAGSRRPYSNAVTGRGR